MPSLVIDPYNFSIEQQRDRLVFTYEKDDIVRTIWLNGAGPKPTVYDSILARAFGRALRERRA